MNCEKDKGTKFIERASRSHSFSIKTSAKSIQPLNDTKIEVKPFDFLANEEVEYEFNSRGGVKP